MNIPSINLNHLKPARHLVAGIGGAVPLSVGAGMAIYDAATGNDETSVGGYLGGAIGGAAGMSGASSLLGMAGLAAGGIAGGALGAGASLATRGRLNPMNVGTAGALLGGVYGSAAGALAGARGGYEFSEELGDRANALLNRHLGL